MSGVYFTSDTHFGHANILQLTGRPFADVNEMDAALYAGWEHLKPGDTLYHLGDVTWDHTLFGIKFCLGRLWRRGVKVFLVPGNHDRQQAVAHARMRGLVELPPIYEVTHGGQKLVLSHYCIADWPGRFTGAVHLHGHSHGKLDYTPAVGKRIDVSVECTGYKPISLEEVMEGRSI
jgi:calcineurin-like phosphoesterase family protein